MPNDAAPRQPSVIVPASAANLGASFDACGLALALYLKVTVCERRDEFEIEASGEGADQVERGEGNLIARVARAVAASRRRELPGARLRVESEIPLARGLGSSSSAIIAGVSIYEILSGERLRDEEIFAAALAFEGHGDNLAAALLGGLVVTCAAERPGGAALVAVKRPWPDEVRVVLAIPDYEMETARMRAVLPEKLPRADAVFNLQRSALLQAALAERRFDLLGEALRDRLHQPYRAPLGAGIREVLRMNDEAKNIPGLLGVALSGAGPTMLALATENEEGIADEMRRRLKAAGASARTLAVAVDHRGRVFENAP